MRPKEHALSIPPVKVLFAGDGVCVKTLCWYVVMKNSSMCDTCNTVSKIENPHLEPPIIDPGTPGRVLPPFLLS
jgi:hypothetical protein